MANSNGANKRACPRALRTLDRRDRLEALVHQAWELRRSPYFRDGLEAVVDEWDRRQLAVYELRQQRVADLIRVLRETDPRRSRRRDTA